MKISIITPTYNRASLIEETVHSILSQTHPDIEYLVLDDGSKDSTRDVLAPYMGRLRYEYGENIGETRTVNKGYKMVSGDAVIIVNSDDPLLRNDAVTLLAEALENDPSALAAYPDYIYIDETGKEIKRQEQIDFNFQNMLETFNITLGPGMCIRRDALQHIGYRNETLRYTGDVDVSLRLAALGKLVHVKKFLASHRIHPSSASLTCKSATMAQEVVRLMENNITHEFFSTMSIANKAKMLAFAHDQASNYCDFESIEYSVHRMYVQILLQAKNYIQDPLCFTTEYSSGLLFKLEELYKKWMQFIVKIFR